MTKVDKIKKLMVKYNIPIDLAQYIVDREESGAQEKVLIKEYIKEFKRAEKWKNKDKKKRK